VFGVTKGLLVEFGDRIFDTPISESAILGSAVGAAMMGLRPVVEVMWADFSLVALDQMVNQAANARYVSRGTLQVPLVMRTQQGALPGACAQHSQSLEAIFCHIPGLRVAVPATAQDAYDLLLASIACDDPVVFIEHRALYNGPREKVVVGGPVPAMGGAVIRVEGDDVTVVTWGTMVHSVLAASQQLSVSGIGTEVVDLRWLNPFDSDLVVASVKKTGRLVIVHEANRTGGFGAEVIARVAESAAPLRSPPRRLGLPDTRIPAAPILLDALIPSVESIVAEVQSFWTYPGRLTPPDVTKGLLTPQI
jgi:pyruvate dehydrogenase E1 component beta subunit